MRRHVCKWDVVLTFANLYEHPFCERRHLRGTFMRSSTLPQIPCTLQLVSTHFSIPTNHCIGLHCHGIHGNEG